MSYNPFSIEGKTILITGASSGIGQVTATECSKLGAKMIITGRNEKRLHHTLSMLHGEGHRAILCDLSSSADVESLVDNLPELEGCVCNAGFNSVQPISFIKETDLHEITGVNLISPILLTRMLVKKKRLMKGSAIVYTTSISRKIASVGNCVYSATKGGLTSFMRNAALELAAKNIRCNAVSPGMIETPLKANKTSITDEQWERNRHLYPLKRFGLPEDVAYAIIYLLSDASCWITGTELVVDGGRSLN